jgi:LPS sulfotransferase NodH
MFFEEKEGSTAVLQFLDALGMVSVVRRETEAGLGGWEPFEWFNCGSLGPRKFRRCLELIFCERPLNIAQLNEIYMSTARAPLRSFDASSSVGFKMRITPPWDIPFLPAASAVRRMKPVDLLTKALRRLNRGTFRRLMAESLAAMNVVVFVMVRQDIFRWAISKYHGDGTGRAGHLQFRMAGGEIDDDAVPAIRFDPDLFGRIIDKCTRIHETKRWWSDSMRAAGIEVHALRYEDFLSDRTAFFARLLGHLDMPVENRELEARLAQQIRLRRVHGSDISRYVENHREITRLYGDRFIRW